MKRILFSTLAFALIVAGAMQSPALAKGVSGAIFTTTFDGSVVNGNKYTSKCAVYLDGGPGPNAPPNAAGLPDGDYYFQVTDPSGKDLLSTDDVENRRFTVSGGVITGHSGTHPTGVDMDHGAETVGVADVSCPSDFLDDTSNDGGVYKVWATPVGDYVADLAACGGGCFHGFVASNSKTDNFKVQAPPSTATFCLTLGKLFSDIGDNRSPVENWELLLTDPLGTTNSYFTGADGLTEVCGLAPGSYTVNEVLGLINGQETQILGLLVNDQLYYRVPGDEAYLLTWTESDPEPVIIYINQQTSGDQ